MKITATLYKKGETYGGHPAESDCVEITIGNESRTLLLGQIAHNNHDEILVDLPGYNANFYAVEHGIDKELRSRIAPSVIDAFGLVGPYIAALAKAPESHQAPILDSYIEAWVETNWEKIVPDLLEMYSESLENDIKHGDCSENALRYALRETEIATDED